MRLDFGCWRLIQQVVKLALPHQLRRASVRAIRASRYPAVGRLISKPNFCGALVFYCVACSSLFLRAQEISIAKSEPPYYVGEPVVVQIGVELDNDTQEVDCQYAGPPLDGAEISGPSVGTSTSQSVQMINGRVTRQRTISYRFNFQIAATQAGEVRAGPFLVSIDGREREVQGTSFQFEELEEDPDMDLKIEVGDSKIYVGEQVPVKISWSFDGELTELRYMFPRLRIRSPFFDQFEFQDPPAANRDTRLRIETAQDTLEVDAQLQQTDEGFLVSAERLLVAGNPGEYRDMLVTCRTERVTRWGRDFFGDLVVRGTKPAVAASEPFSLTILPLPTADRPASFSGAVGKGYSIQVSANRSVVRVGDPIALDVVIQGSGNLENLSLPNMAGPDGFNQELFQLPAESPAGIYANRSKQFKLNVRVKDQDVEQIPALPFSWFNPDREEYQTVYSKPIALQVMEAQMISSADVISAAPDETDSTGNTPARTKSGARQAVDLLGANLAIEQNTTRLLATGGLVSRRWTVPALYSLGIFSLLLAFWVRTRREIDPAIANRRAVEKSVRSQLQAAETMAPKQAAEATAIALRELVTDRAGGARSEAEAIIADCEAIVFAPTEPDARRIQELIQRAEVVSGRLVEAS